MWLEEDYHPALLGKQNLRKSLKYWEALNDHLFLSIQISSQVDDGLRYLNIRLQFASPQSYSLICPDLSILCLGSCSLVVTHRQQPTHFLGAISSPL